ncbi:quinone-dependent dihydroorotate dehydrogenase [Candidatus Nomurabacteria bacterium]|uniref:Dihydroorotate dehydrogenase (quinone) n=1 Tax=candidate division WWE3 bacterium TaxID=2053526 RepID=A0A955E0L8_UNCKA|nr:quinone-dependent dihydroorotate dehydrogenase [candidate division WWE3 bacterium]MCB9823640.1 quinone-dependent dihydroorotate dehydrogenase [Candidatus Nomurabacteria bacterium]MCB9827282.1 quinone-dependent dihydroorotate dehydrogenase [Candidatus Nomurabacteria bacterium]MCB9827435.1 quinone-dependent dihydroorotate dehydrogenase [Candidatus Nomurabacteria bacterium]HXK52825.1 quinone-dependent dihydroorotate dehydrogenase [bacterium]
MSLNPYSLYCSVYRNIARPLLFLTPSEKIHERALETGEKISNNKKAAGFIRNLCNYDNSALEQEILGVKYRNPVGLAAGFDYDGNLASFMSSLGFGFNTVGTVTALPYEGNTGPRLGRLVKSKSLLVNKGFKSEGAEKIFSRLAKKDLSNITLGISIGSSNLPEIDTTEKAINDYSSTFNMFNDVEYVDYFELNVSCPNTKIKEPFTNCPNLSALLSSLSTLKIKVPMYLKLPNEISAADLFPLIDLALGKGVSGVILSNLVKDRSNPMLDEKEIAKVSSLKGNFSGKPAAVNANNLIGEVYKRYGKDLVIVGCGGVFNAKDAYEKIKLGASLVQLVTGLVYEGPTVAANINMGLVELLRKDGYENISEAIGVGNA